MKGHHLMRKIIEYTLVSVDGVFAGADISGFFEYRDDAYLRDRLGQLLACDAMLMGRNTYFIFKDTSPAKIYPRSLSDNVPITNGLQDPEHHRGLGRRARAAP